MLRLEYIDRSLSWRGLLGLIALTFGLLFSQTGEAAEFKTQGQAFALDVPSDWNPVLPNPQNVVLQGPADAEGIHAVIFVTHTGLKGVHFRPEVMKGQLRSYSEGRREYVATKGGVLLRTLPYALVKRPNITEAHETGVDYTLGGETYYERTSFVSCQGSIFQVKTLDFKKPSHSQSAYHLGETFRCVP